MDTALLESGTMPKPDKESVPTKSIAARLPEPLLDKVDRFRDSQPFRPTLTQVLEAALTEYLERRTKAPHAKPRREPR